MGKVGGGGSGKGWGQLGGWEAIPALMETGYSEWLNKHLDALGWWMLWAGNVGESVWQSNGLINVG